MNSKLLIVVVTHERPEYLEICLKSIKQIKSIDSNDLIKFFCVDNSIIHQQSNYKLFKKYNIEYFQQPGATQIDNFLKSLQIAHNYPFFAIIHDDDIILKTKYDLSEISLLNNRSLYYFDSNIFNSDRILLSRKINLAQIKPQGRYLSYFFPHRMPLFPTYIYPNSVIDLYAAFLSSKKNINKFGKYIDSALLATLITKFNFNLIPFNSISYIYIVHAGQDSKSLDLKQKLNLFQHLKSMSRYTAYEYSSAVFNIIRDILKGFLYNKISFLLK